MDTSPRPARGSPRSGARNVRLSRTASGLSISTTNLESPLAAVVAALGLDAGTPSPDCCSRPPRPPKSPKQQHHPARTHTAAWAPRRRILWHQAVFLVTGIVSTLGAQALFYMNAADASSLLTILTTYVGMALVLLIPSAGARRASAASKRRSSAAAASLLPTTKAASLSALGGAEAAAAAASSSSSSSSSALHGSDASPNHALLIALSIPDVLGSILLNIGLFYVGSGSYQVIYSSVIIFTAIFSLIFMRRRMSRAQWLSIIVITLGLSISAWGPGGSDFGAPGPGVSPHLLAVNASGLASSPPTPPKPAIPPYPFPTGAAKIGSKNFAWGLGNKGSGSAAGEIEINEVAAAAALSDGNNLLANTDGSTVLQAGSPGAAAQDRLFAADPSQPPAVPRAHSDGLALGFAITLAGTALYASVYCLNDYYLTEAAVRLSPRAQCGWVGVYASVMVMLLQYFFSAKSLATMPLTSPSVITGYVVLTLASLLHNLSYFELLASTGAVATGVIQALRAVLVFALSHVWFCGRDPAQCLNMAKVVAAAVVVAGVLWFSIEKARVEEREREARGAAKP